MAFRGRADDREAEARARRLRAPAPEALERRLRGVGRRPRAGVFDAQAREPILLGHSNPDRAVARPMEAGVLDEVREGSLEGGALAADAHRAGRLDLDAGLRLGCRAGELVETH